jgi:predicted lysophospholipase L1 biosynthesis ABC-type transport system permease subunit
MEPNPRSPVGFILTIAAVCVAAVLGLTVLFWVLGVVASVFGWAIRVAFLAAVAAFVWHFVSRRLSRNRC